MNKKFLLISIFTILIMILSFTLIGCKPGEATQIDTNITVSSLEDIVFLKGDTLEWKDYTLNVFSGDNLLEQIRLSPDMLKDGELDKLNTIGTKTLEVLYKGKTAFVTVTVKQKPIVTKFNVTFNAGDGYFGSNESDKIIVKSLAEMDAVIIPKRESYVFAGWFEDVGKSETQYITGKIITRDVVLHAKWDFPDDWSVEYKLSLDDAIQDIVGVNKQTFKHGSVITLRAPEKFPSNNFIKYRVETIENNVVTDSDDYVYIENQGVHIEVRSNLRIILIYETKTFTVEYLAVSPLDNAVSRHLETGIRYGMTNVAHYFSLSEVMVEGHKAEWVDTETNTVINDFKVGVFRDYTIRARYTKLKYQVRFLDENENEIMDFRRMEVEYNTFLQNPPSTPSKDGHTGAWSLLIAGVKEPINLLEFQIKSDTNIYAIYDTNQYTVQFKFEMINKEGGSRDALTISQEYEYGTELYEVDMINLYQNLTINGQEYVGYNSKYIYVKWQVNRKPIVFPYKVSHITDERSLNAVWGYKDYIVDFIIPPKYGEYNTIRKTVHPNSQISPPSYNIEGYTIIGWRHNRDYIDFSTNTTYKQNDLVRYDGVFYQCKQNDTIGVIPSSGRSEEYWEDLGTIHPKVEFYFTESLQLEVSDFRQYNDDPLLDRSFTPILVVNEYTISFYTWKITGTDPNYEINKNFPQSTLTVQHGDTLKPDTYYTEIPVYPGRESDFRYIGCFTNSNYSSEIIEKDVEFRITGEISFYSYWTDILAGTEGLEFEYYSEENNSYKLVNYNPTIKNVEIGELVIPEKHNGKPVVSIASEAFVTYDHGVKFTTISIPSSIMHIGDMAFLGCSFLETINLADNDFFTVDTQGSLLSSDGKKIYLVPANKTYTNETYNISSTTIEIAPGAFANCKTISQVNFCNMDESFDGPQLEVIGKMSFSSCENLLSFNIPNSVTTIDSYAFQGCYKLTDISIGNNSNLYKLGECVLSDDNPWYVLESNEQLFVKLGEILLAYNYANSLSSDVVIPDNIISIADGAFKTNMLTNIPSNITNITFTSASLIKFIGDEAFLGCNVLNMIAIQKDIKVDFAINTFKGIPTTCKLGVKDVSAYEIDPFVTAYFDVASNTLIELL